MGAVPFLVTGCFLGPGSRQGVGWPAGARAYSVGLSDALQLLSASLCCLPQALPVPSAPCRKIGLIYAGTWQMTSLLPFKLLLPVNKEPAEGNWRCFVSAACAELAGRSHLHWLWAQHSLWGFGLCH